MSMEKKTKKKTPRDPFFRPKYIGYCWSETPLDKVMFEDLSNFAKFQLCLATNRLMKDPVWDSYTTEEILVEFFARKFSKDRNYLKEFELSLAKNEINDFGLWADKLIDMDNKEKEEKIKNLEENITFSPTDVMGG
jgi:hypothetical protein